MTPVKGVKTLHNSQFNDNKMCRSFKRSHGITSYSALKMFIDSSVGHAWSIVSGTFTM